jgi:hypothetical protein
MTPEQFLLLQQQLWLAFGPLVPWLLVALLVGGILTGLMIFALVMIRGI